jgi:FkbM family methyltransferase
MIGELGENLVFLLGLPRSGTTLLSVLLNQHPQVHCPSEPWVMLALEAVGRTPDTDPADAAVLYHAMAEFMGGDLSIEAARAYARTAYNAKLKEAGKTIFIDKTPRYYLILPFIYQVFPKARYIMLLRNPMDVAASMKQTWKFDLRREFDQKEDALGSVDLSYGLRQLMHFSVKPEHPAFFVRYEELVRDTHPKMVDVFNFLKIDPLLAPHDGTFNVGESSFARSAVGDRKILATHSPHQKSVDSWKRVFEPDEAGVILNAIGPGMFRDLGYGTTLQDAAAMGVQLKDESHALQHFERLTRAVLDRVHKYTACTTFAELLPERASLATELGGELPLDPMMRVQVILERVRQLKAAAMNAPGSHAAEFARAIKAIEQQHVTQIERVTQQLAHEKARNVKLTTALESAAGEILALQNESDRLFVSYEKLHGAAQYWVDRSKQLSERLRFMINQWPLKAAWKLHVQEMPFWAPEENNELVPPAFDGLPKPVRRLTDWAERLRAVVDRTPDEMTAALSHLMAKGFRPKVVLDIGAAKGYWSEIAQYLFFSDAHFYMIDPLKQSEEHLAELAGRNKQFHYLLVAVGSEPGSVQMNVGNDPDASSLLSFGPQTQTQQTVIVETIDRLIEQNKIPQPQMAKIDVQGFEIEVLKGAQKMLESTEVIIIEVNLYEFMNQTPLADRVISYMAEKGYRIFDIAGRLRRPYQNDLAQMDIVFVKNDSALVSSNRWDL